MRYKTFTFIITLIFFSIINVFSQEENTTASNHVFRAAKANSSKPLYMRMIVKTAPKLTLQFSGGYNFGVYELSGNGNGDFNPLEFSSGENFGVRHGVGSSITLKIPLHERGNIRLNISALYNMFSSKFSKLNTGSSPNDFVNFNVYSGEAGLENNFTPNFKFKTLVGVGIIGSVITGKAKITDVNGSRDLTIMPAFRLGVSLYSGFEYLMTDKLGLNFGFKFTHANLWLKQTKESTDPNRIYLNDKREVPRPEYSGFKQFAWGSFYGGVNIYFGISNKEYIFRK